MIWVLATVVVSFVVLVYLVRLLSERLLLAAEVSAGQQAEEASDLRKLTNKALHSRLPRRTGQEP